MTAEISVGLYDAERTVVDVFRLRHLLGSDLAHQALRRFLRMPGTSAGALMDTASRFPKARTRIELALEALL